MRYLLTCTAYLLLLLGCVGKPQHPQAEIYNNNKHPAHTAQTINAYVDSLDAQKASLNQTVSLVYEKSDVQLFTERYVGSNRETVYISHIDSGGVSSKHTSYYLKDDTLYLVKELTKMHTVLEESWQERHQYFRNNILFKQHSRKAGTLADLNEAKLSYDKVSNDQTSSLSSNLKEVQAALLGEIPFDMVFDELTTLPTGKYLRLRGKSPDGYAASIRVAQSDMYIDSVSKNPESFKDKKLNINWKVKDKEAIYVPATNGTTSAKGLNK